MTIKDIQTYREDKRGYWMDPHKHRSHFLGRSALDMHLEKKRPSANVSKEGNLFKLALLMPGFAKDDIDIQINDDVLYVKASKEKDKGHLSDHIIREFDIDTLERRFNLAKDVGKSKIDARYENGILTITFYDIPPRPIESVKRTVELS